MINKPVIDDDEFDGAAGLGAGTSSSDERYWYTDLKRLGIVEKGTTTRDGKTSDYQSISETGKEIRIYSISRAVDFTTDLTEISPLPTEFHIALVYKTLSDGYLRAGDTFNPQASQIFDMKYEKLVKESKKQARSSYQGGAGIIAPTEF